MILQILVTNGVLQMQRFTKFLEILISVQRVRSRFRMKIKRPLLSLIRIIFIPISAVVLLLLAPMIPWTVITLIGLFLLFFLVYLFF